MTGHTTLAHSPGTGPARMLLVILLVAAGLALVGFVLAAAMRFALPSPAFIKFGLVGDFPPSDQPYTLRLDDGLFYVVNTGDELIAQYPIHPISPFCRISWWVEKRVFIDPCRGTQFELDGSYHTGPPATMRRYPLEIKDGVVWVDLTRTLPGPEPVVVDINSEFR